MSTDHTVYIVDDDEAIRSSLGFLLKSTGIATKEYETANAFLDDYNPDKTGCVVVDVRMPGMSGLELQEALAQQQSCLPVIVMTGHGDVSMAVKAMKAGATDFIEKPFSNQDLLDKIQTCLAESDKLQSHHKLRSDVIQRLTLLSDRERQVMNLLVEGKHNKQIADKLNISIRTVEAHRAKVMEKLQAGSLADVVRMSLLD